MNGKPNLPKSGGQRHARTVGLCSVSIAAALTVVCSGCVSMGKRIDPETLEQIKIGTSTRADVEALLGQPRETTVGPGGEEVLTYFHLSGWLIPPGELIASGLNLAKVPLVGSVLPKVWTGGSTNTECVSITLDGDGKVLGISTCVMDVEYGSGFLDDNQQSLVVTYRGPSAPGSVPPQPAVAPELCSDSREPPNQPGRVADNR
ncbi:MAG: hypothetical protein JXO22_09385 [Phycisphaerae bacterium]|nr:hypothetical protein [Phycisphaerae bacterium]